MPPRKATTKNTPTKTLEQTLWDAADKMRGNLEAGEYKHVVLGLVFLKYVSDAFAERRAWLEHATADPTNNDYYVPNPDRRAGIIDDRNEYTADNVFWVPQAARWTHLQDRAKQPDIGVLIDTAIAQLVSQAVAADEVIDVYGAAGMERPDTRSCRTPFSKASATATNRTCRCNCFAS